MVMSKKEELIKAIQVSNTDVAMLREQFIENYSKQKGWDSNNLSTKQMLEITSQKEYKTPGIVHS